MVPALVDFTDGSDTDWGQLATAALAVADPLSRDPRRDVDGLFCGDLSSANGCQRFVGNLCS